MLLTDGRGLPLNSEYSVEADGRHLAIILESQGGKPRRNPAYREALLLLLARLKDLGATIEVALVDSLVTQQNNISEAERTVLGGPMALAHVADLLALRRRLTTGQTSIAQRPGVRGGNSTKRLRLRLTIPGYDISDTERLAADLAAGVSPQPDEAMQDKEAEVKLLAALGLPAELAKAENVHVTSAIYERTPGTVVVRRAEAVLVALYRQSVAGLGDHRLRTAVGFTDLYLSDSGDIIEAKRGSEHRYVREALGQLLDYAVHVTVPVRKLTALFPASPSEADIKLLHTYGVDCLYWEGASRFVRIPASAAARAAMESIRASADCRSA
ncbi:hypothetical protein [Dactylosporangium sp. NPDC049140]|uniref:hypothetical protein n=1 Tax=Dactylosporangium sp. NPDC049140 TaxID=3155647 RepID=UPI0033D6471D